MSFNKSGVIVADKPAGMSSAHVVTLVKRWLNAKKVGHAGTLDPFATGVLVLCINAATRLAGFFLTGDKAYRAVLTLGAETDTQDATGEVVRECEVGSLTEEKVKAVFARYTGDLMQTPPVFSALKHDGKPLYKLARAGKAVQKPPRPVRISENRVVRVELPDIEFEATCSAGTYIRTLGADIAKDLGTCGYLSALRREASCGFTIDGAHSLDDIRSASESGDLERLFIPAADALSEMPECAVGPELVKWIRHGGRLHLSDIPTGAEVAPGSPVKVVDENRALVAVVALPENAGHYAYRMVAPAED